MLEHEQVVPKKDPPGLGAYVAAILEIGFLAVFAWHQSFAGAFLWLMYFHFSACRALIADMFV